MNSRLSTRKKVEKHTSRPLSLPVFKILQFSFSFCRLSFEVTLSNNEINSTAFATSQESFVLTRGV